MSRSKKQKNPSGKKYTKPRKMKPYCLTGEKRNHVSYLESGASYENYNNPADAKKARDDFQLERKAEKKKTRQQAKNKLRKDLDNLDED